MGDKAPKLEEGEVLDRTPARSAAPLHANATPQERLAAILRRIETARTTFKLGPVEVRPSYAAHRAAPPSGLATVPLTHSVGYPVPFRLPQNYTGGDTGCGDRVPGPGPGVSRPYQSLAGGRSMGYGNGSPAPGPIPLVRGGGREGRNAGPVQQLSSECQRRRFNPEFKVTMHDDRYKCDVLVQTVVIQGSKHYEKPQDAKAHTAIKALKTVQSWPVPGSTHLPASSGGRREPQHGGKAEAGKGAPRPSGPSGPSMASGVDMSDPLQARAFVEGFRMGQLSAMPGGRSTEAQPEGGRSKKMSASLRSRSRSPRRCRQDSHRSRSPRRYFDGSRHDPSLPSTDKYRPTGPALLRRDLKQAGKLEDSYGRLKENDYY